MTRIFNKPWSWCATVVNNIFAFELIITNINRNIVRNCCEYWWRQFRNQLRIVTKPLQVSRSRFKAKEKKLWNSATVRRLHAYWVQHILILSSQNPRGEKKSYTKQSKKVWGARKTSPCCRCCVQEEEEESRAACGPIENVQRQRRSLVYQVFSSSFSSRFRVSPRGRPSSREKPVGQLL